MKLEQLKKTQIALDIEVRSLYVTLGTYTPKNYDLFKVVENRMQQCCAAHIVHSCQQCCSALLSLIAG